jgi:uncharacterized protein
VKRYVAEPGSELVRESMDAAQGWFMGRHGYVETVRAVGLTAGAMAVRSFEEEWSSFAVIELDAELVERAASLTLERDLPSLDALHLAAALVLPKSGLVMATWDRRLHAAARAEGFDVLPERLSRTRRSRS